MAPVKFTKWFSFLFCLTSVEKVDQPKQLRNGFPKGTWKNPTNPTQWTRNGWSKYSMILVLRSSVDCSSQSQRWWSRPIRCNRACPTRSLVTFSRPLSTLLSPPKLRKKKLRTTTKVRVLVRRTYVFPPGYVGFTEAPFRRRNLTVSTRLALRNNAKEWENVIDIVTSVDVNNNTIINSKSTPTIHRRNLKTHLSFYG